jgi:hypothetical protein
VDIVAKQQALIDEINEREAPEGEIALRQLQAVYRDKLAPLSIRMRAAALALPHESASLLLRRWCATNTPSPPP